MIRLKAVSRLMLARQTLAPPKTDRSAFFSSVPLSLRDVESVTRALGPDLDWARGTYADQQVLKAVVPEAEVQALEHKLAAKGWQIMPRLRDRQFGPGTWYWFMAGRTRYGTSFVVPAVFISYGSEAEVYALVYTQTNAVARLIAAIGDSTDSGATSDSEGLVPTDDGFVETVPAMRPATVPAVQPAGPGLTLGQDPLVPAPAEDYDKSDEDGDGIIDESVPYSDLEDPEDEEDADGEDQQDQDVDDETL